MPDLRTTLVYLLGCSLFLFYAGCMNESSDRDAPPPLLTEAEEVDGWRLLFDGASLSGWRGVGRDSVPGGHWRVEDGVIHKVAVNSVPADFRDLSGDIMTVETFEDFELILQWKIASGANTGLKYNVSEAMSVRTSPRHAALGFEYQMIDDEGFPEPLAPAQLTGALYDLVPSDGANAARPAGEWNDTRIVFDGSHGEHWLNGERVAAFELSGEEFGERLAVSKFRDIDGFATHRSGHIVLQDHSDDAWFRSIKIRELE